MLGYHNCFKIYEKTFKSMRKAFWEHFHLGNFFTLASQKCKGWGGAHSLLSFTLALTKSSIDNGKKNISPSYLIP